MKRSRRENPEATISFLDVISCGFGAIVLLLIIARIGDPIAFEKAEQFLKKSIQELQLQLFSIRDNTASVNDQLISKTEQLDQLEKRIALLKEKLASVEKQLASKTSAETNEATELQLALQILTEEMSGLISKRVIKLLEAFRSTVNILFSLLIRLGACRPARGQKCRQKCCIFLRFTPKSSGFKS